MTDSSETYLIGFDSAFVQDTSLPCIITDQSERDFYSYYPENHSITQVQNKDNDSAFLMRKKEKKKRQQRNSQIKNEKKDSKRTEKKRTQEMIRQKMTQAREYRWAKQDANKGEETKDYSLQFQSELRIDIETSKQMPQALVPLVNNSFNAMHASQSNIRLVRQINSSFSNYWAIQSSQQSQQLSQSINNETWSSFQQTTFESLRKIRSQRERSKVENSFFRKRIKDPQISAIISLLCKQVDQVLELPLEAQVPNMPEFDSFNKSNLAFKKFITAKANALKRRRVIPVR